MLGVNDDANVESGVCGFGGRTHLYLVSLALTRGGSNPASYCITSKI